MTLLSSRDLPVDREECARLLEHIKQVLPTRGVELFVHEARDNGYTPEPPKGWFAIRSHKRRLFVRLNRDGAQMPTPDQLQKRLDAGDYMEMPL